jgi:uncharacterized membrane protein YfcA
LKYNRAGINQEIDLGKARNFWKLFVGGFGAGFVQGTIGVGAGTFLMMVLLEMPIDSRSAAATSVIGSGA